MPLRDPCPLCADAGFLRADDGSLDACGRCARVAEAEFRFAALSKRKAAPAPAPQPSRRAPRAPRNPHSRPVPRRAGAIPATRTA